MKNNGFNAALKKFGIILLILGIVVYFGGIGFQAVLNGNDEVIQVNNLMSACPAVASKLYGDTVVSSGSAQAVADSTSGENWLIEQDIRFASALNTIEDKTDGIALDEDAKADILVKFYNNRMNYISEAGAIDLSALLTDVVADMNASLAAESQISEDEQKKINRSLNVLNNGWAEEDAEDPTLASLSISNSVVKSKMSSFKLSQTILTVGAIMVGFAALVLIIAGLTKQKITVKELKKFGRSDEITTFLPLLVIILITTAIRPDFLTVRNFSAMFTQIPFIAICALGASFPLMVGSADISTGRVAGFAGILMAVLVYDYSWSPALAIVAALAACVVVGLWNGFLVVIMGIPDFVATMGTLYIIGGARYLFIHGYELTLGRVSSFHLDEVFDGRYMGMPLYFWIMILLFAIVFVVVKKMVWGRRLLATGDNREVANIVGINPNKMRMSAFFFSSFFAGIAGILLVLDTSFAKPEYGDGWEFRAIAGCVVGGTSLSGGKCSPLGILIGVTLVFVAENAIIFLGLPSTMREAVKGFLMAAAVLFDVWRNSRKVAA